MSSYSQQPAVISLKDILYVILKRIWIIVLVGLVFACALFIYKYNSRVNDSNVLDISTKLEGESDYAYSERVLKVNQAKDIVDSINALNDQIASQREYVSKSIYMQIDTLNEAVTTAQLVISIDNNTMSGLDNALVTSYVQDIKAGGYLEELAEAFGTEQEYLKELVRVELSDFSSIVVNVNEDYMGSSGIITITVIGPDLDYTQKIMDCILEEVDSKCIELNETMVPHMVALSGRQDFYMVDTNTRDIQNNAANRFGTLQKQIETYDKTLEDLAPEIGVDSKESIYAFFSYNINNTNNSSSPLGTAIKYAVIGLAGGAFLVIIAIVLNYVFGLKFSSQAKFFGLFPSVKKIGVSKPTNRRSVYDRFIDNKSGDDNALTNEINSKLIAGNIINLSLGMNKILVTGTAEALKIKELVDSLDINVDVKESFFADPSCLALLSEYDGVIIVEQRNYSNCKVIAEEIKLINNTSAVLIGAIVI